MITREEFYDLSGVEDPRVRATAIIRRQIACHWEVTKSFPFPCHSETADGSVEPPASVSLRHCHQHAHGDDAVASLQRNVQPHEGLQSKHHRGRDRCRQARVNTKLSGWTRKKELIFYLLIGSWMLSSTMEPCWITWSHKMRNAAS